MRLNELQQSLTTRVRNPGYWVVLLSLGLLAGSFVAMVTPKHELGSYLTFLLFAALWVPIIFLSPMPWQWTGDDRPLAPWGRGLLQGLAYALLVGGLHALVVFILPEKGDQGFLLGMITGLGAIALIFQTPLGILIARSECLSRETREATIRAQQAQWMSHRGAFSPRLLFGNLDHLAGLAHEDPRGTEKGLVDLAALYRQWLIEAEKPVIPLSAELRMAEQYLALEQNRWKVLLQTRTHFDLEQDEQPVPPLLLLSFLEQALTGSPIEPVALDIQVSGTVSWLEIRLDIRGSIPVPSLEALAQSRRRILAALGSEGSVAHDASEAGWKLTLRVPKRNMEMQSCS